MFFKDMFQCWIKKGLLIILKSVFTKDTVETASLYNDMRKTPRLKNRGKVVN